ncbi:hypothetical protein VP01_231g2 [Puccinia sorghi]|uniref:Uncharacterized protein n=1 Tax=Puccinia sorghi TaxID=27349 RepID=A0A0L6V7S3_9BASI|nr:hypothetical protein VP01_231g2 [Puccinia sorghi]
MDKKNRQSSHKTVELGGANGEQLSGSGDTPPSSIDNPQIQHRKTSLRAEDLLSCNDQLLMPNPLGKSLGFNPNQKEIGPALTPLIGEVDQDQDLVEVEIDQLIQTSKSLTGSLSSPDPNHIDKDLEEPQTVGRSISKHHHHHPTENAPEDSMMISGILIFVSSSLLWIIGIPLILFDLDSFSDKINDANDDIDPTKSSVSVWLKWLLIKILDDQHYKYFLPLQITFGLVFVIINWGGLKIFRHS